MRSALRLCHQERRRGSCSAPIRCSALAVRPASLAGLDAGAARPRVAPGWFGGQAAEGPLTARMVNVGLCESAHVLAVATQGGVAAVRVHAHGEIG